MRIGLDRLRDRQSVVRGNEGSAISRITYTSKTTILELLVMVGEKHERFVAENIPGVHAEDIQCDEFWQYNLARRRPPKARSTLAAAVIRGAGPPSSVTRSSSSLGTTGAARWKTAARSCGSSPWPPRAAPTSRRTPTRPTSRLLRGTLGSALSTAKSARCLDRLPKRCSGNTHRAR